MKHYSFPHMGWSCVGCRRGWAFINTRCGYCRDLISKEPACAS